MRKFYLLILLSFVGMTFGQMRVISKKVQDLNAKNTTFANYQLFTKNNDLQKSAKYINSATDATVLEINQNELERIAKEAPSNISIAIPYQSELIKVQIYKQTVLTESFTAMDNKGNIIDYTPGKYYRGIVAGDETSIVAISFFDDSVMGVISTKEKGNIVLGKSTDKQDYITYSDKNLLGKNQFICGVDDLEYNKQIEQNINFDPMMYKISTTENCVKIYYEIAYEPYKLNGYDVDTTLDWITGIQNNIGTLYNNDGINVALHMVKVWTEEDPYDGSYSENLNEFRQTVTDFPGDLAHLVNSPVTTSVAYLDSLCSSYKYAYSGIALNYAEVPTYSWTIMAMTHEMGHSLGSPHTHACAWNGDNTAIDGCGPQAGYDEGCSGPIPSGGGTIMSYCHATNVGVNFTKGFGEQPGTLIRNNVDSKDCLSTDCSCMLTVAEIGLTYLENGDIQVKIEDNTSTEWKYEVYPYGTIPTGIWETITTTNFTITGLSGNQYYELMVMNICDGGSEGGVKKKIILVGDFCDGTIFTDTGGESGGYANNQYITKTFYPSTTNEKVKIEFSRIGLQADNDFLYVYNGDSTEAPLFDNGTISGNNTLGLTFVSTDTTGAITIEFISNASIVSYGWKAVVDCAALGIEDISDSYGVTVYPNPTSDVLNIISRQERIESISLMDITGKNILSTKIGSTKNMLNIEHLPKGVYLLKIEIEGKEITKKIIKK